MEMEAVVKELLKLMTLFDNLHADASCRVIFGIFTGFDS